MHLDIFSVFAYDNQPHLITSGRSCCKLHAFVHPLAPSTNNASENISASHSSGSHHRLWLNLQSRCPLSSNRLLRAAPDGKSVSALRYCVWHERASGSRCVAVSLMARRWRRLHDRCSADCGSERFRQTVPWQVVLLVLASTGIGRPPSTCRPGMMRWRTTPSPTLRSATPTALSDAPAQFAPITHRYACLDCANSLRYSSLTVFTFKTSYCFFFFFTFFCSWFGPPAVGLAAQSICATIWTCGDRFGPKPSILSATTHQSKTTWP